MRWRSDSLRKAAAANEPSLHARHLAPRHRIMAGLAYGPIATAEGVAVARSSDPFVGAALIEGAALRLFELRKPEATSTASPRNRYRTPSNWLCRLRAARPPLGLVRSQNEEKPRCPPNR